MGRLGAVRSSIVGYLIPIVALVLGVLVLSEDVEAIQAVGVAIALVGGYIISHIDRSSRPTVEHETPIEQIAEVDFVEDSPVAIHMCR